MVDMKVVTQTLEKVLKQKIDQLSKNDYEQVIYFLHPDGVTADCFSTSKTTSFTKINHHFQLPLNNLSYVFPPPDSISENKKDSTIIYHFPPGGYSYIQQNDLSNLITIQNDTFIYKPTDRKKYMGNHFGIATDKANGINSLSYAWLLPESFEVLYYKSNRKGNWTAQNNMIHFIASPNQNDFLFEIAYKRTTKIPEEINGRKINYTKTINIASPDITIKASDPQRSDSDIISLNLNGEWVLRGFEVSEHPLSLKVTVSNMQNYLILYADNEGIIPPNTAAIEVWDGTTTQKITLNAAKGYCEAIILKR
ncbi:MAG: hypothetical protein KF706_02960 [Chitinophagales bacterium]|nr:hypothetical protein [Chitinophagales bacterium]